METTDVMRLPLAHDPDEYVLFDFNILTQEIVNTLNMLHREVKLSNVYNEFMAHEEDYVTILYSGKIKLFDFSLNSICDIEENFATFLEFDYFNDVPY